MALINKTAKSRPKPPLCKTICHKTVQQIIPVPHFNNLPNNIYSLGDEIKWCISSSSSAIRCHLQPIHLNKAPHAAAVLREMKRKGKNEDGFQLNPLLLTKHSQALLNPYPHPFLAACCVRLVCRSARYCTGPLAT